MKLEGQQLVLDTNILVHWLRGRQAGETLKTDYDLGARRPRPILPVVVKAEIKSLSLQFTWGSGKQRALDELLRELPVADIASDTVIQEYARLDHESAHRGNAPLPELASSRSGSPRDAPSDRLPTRCTRGDLQRETGGGGEIPSRAPAITLAIGGLVAVVTGGVLWALNGRTGVSQTSGPAIRVVPAGAKEAASSPATANSGVVRDAPFPATSSAPAFLVPLVAGTF